MHHHQVCTEEEFRSAERDTDAPRAVHLIRRPQGLPVQQDFAFVAVNLPELEDGQVMVQNLLLSVDPYMRGSMNEDWALHGALEGRSIGKVVASRCASLQEGQLVFHRKGWCTHAILDSAQARAITPLPGVPLAAYLGILGGTGLTAYVALTRTARLNKGDTVYVSAAAGGVGSAAIQMARLLGAGRIVGSAGTDDKVRHLIDVLGCDAAFNYRKLLPHDGLRMAAPDGIDVHLANVGGVHLEAAIANMRPFGRIAWVGAIDQYNSKMTPAAPHNLFDIVQKSLRLEGLLVRHHTHLQHELEQFLAPHLLSGRISCVHTETQGFDNIVTAFIGTLTGSNLGKALVRVANA